MSEYILCMSCGEEVTPDSDFCPHCGVMYELAGKQSCETHPSETATAVCIICRRVLCAQCRFMREGRSFCGDHEAVRVEQDWAVVYESQDPADAQLVKSFLDSIGQKSLVREVVPYGFAWDSGGHGDVSFHMINRGVSVFIPIPDFLAAEENLRAWESGEREEESRS